MYCLNNKKRHLSIFLLIHFCKNINYILVHTVFLNYIVHSIFKLYFKLYALCAHPNAAFRASWFSWTLIVRVVKKVLKFLKIKKNVNNHIRFFYMKNLKNQIILIIIKYSVHAFKCPKNLIIISLLLIWIIEHWKCSSNVCLVCLASDVRILVRWGTVLIWFGQSAPSLRSLS